MLALARAAVLLDGEPLPPVVVAGDGPYRAQAQDSGITLECDVEPGVPPVAADAPRLHLRKGTISERLEILPLKEDPDRDDRSDEDETAPPLEDAFHPSPPFELSAFELSAMGPLVIVDAPTASFVHPLDARTMSSTGSVSAAGLNSGFSICSKRARAAARPSPTLSW